MMFSCYADREAERAHQEAALHRGEERADERNS